jgi:hypothetical protein
MTGGEIAAVGKAIGIASKKTLDEDRKTEDVLLRAAEDTPELRAAARSMAARIAVKERVKLKLYEPFARMLGVSKEYFEDTFPQEMGAKIADIPDEELITPAASVAVPALQGLSYTFDEPTLKEMYLNLLAAASNVRRAGQVHPAFAEIIKQLAPKEADFLDWISAHPDGLHVVRARDVLGDPLTASEVLISALIPAGYRAEDDPEEKFPLATWVDNWQRLGLVNAVFVELLSLDEHRWVRQSPDYVRFRKQSGISTVSFDKGLIRVTSFGRQFFRAVTDA